MNQSHQQGRLEFDDEQIVESEASANCPLISAHSKRDTELWLGIAVGHRELFEALQDGWLRPPTSNTGRVLGVGAYWRNERVQRTTNEIEVHLKLTSIRLPTLNVGVLRDGAWTTIPLSDCRATDAALFWPGVLPTFAISGLAAKTAEQRSRLQGMAGQVANMDLPCAPTEIQQDESPDCIYFDPPCDTAEDSALELHGLDIPPEMDAAQGAMCMALWAVPCIPPWLDLLVTSLSANPREHERLESLTKAVDAPWWRLPPWDPQHREAVSHDLPAKDNDEPQVALWYAAVRVFGCLRTDDPVSPSELAVNIESIAQEFGCPEPLASAWHTATRRILRGESTISFGNWRERPVELAIQLVLARPEPIRFESWSKDIPDLPPSIWWSAAALCGLRHGYRRLDKRFRGTSDQQATVAIHALHTSTGTDLSWPWLSGAPRWHQESDGCALLWGEREIVRKRTRERGSMPPPHPSGKPPPGSAGRATHPTISGLVYVPDFVDAAEQGQLLQLIDESRWSNELQRRVQHYGWRYDYKKRQVDPSMHIGALPDWAQKLARCLVDAGHLSACPDQVIVNEYRGNQGISAHVDSSSFEDDIATISLCEAWEMEFSRCTNLPKPLAWSKHSLRLEVGSALIMRGEARYEWTHEIPKRQSEPNPKCGGRIKRGRRLSLTFRKVKRQPEPAN